MRQGSAPNFCPPIEEGVAFVFQDEEGEVINLEFLGLILKDERRYGFFFPLTSEGDVGASGEVVLLEVVALDEEGQPEAFELVEDEAIANAVYQDFQVATKDLYDFS